MEKLIRFAVKLMERQNRDPEFIPSQNPSLNPSQNMDINSSQNPEINSSQNPNWKQNQWNLFKKTILWEYLTDKQKELCKKYLKSL